MAVRVQQHQIHDALPRTSRYGCAAKVFHGDAGQVRSNARCDSLGDFGSLAFATGLSQFVLAMCGRAEDVLRRAEAFAACHALIDRLKESVPIWKHQSFSDGESEWVNSA